MSDVLLLIGRAQRQRIQSRTASAMTHLLLRTSTAALSRPQHRSHQRSLMWLSYRRGHSPRLLRRQSTAQRPPTTPVTSPRCPLSWNQLVLLRQITSPIDIFELVPKHFSFRLHLCEDYEAVNNDKYVTQSNANV